MKIKRQHDAWDTRMSILLLLLVLIDGAAICMIFHSVHNNWLLSAWMTFCVLVAVKFVATQFNEPASHQKVKRVLLGLLTLVTGCIAVYTLFCVCYAQVGIFTLEHRALTGVNVSAAYYYFGQTAEEISRDFYTACEHLRYAAAGAATSATLYLSFLNSERKRHSEETEQCPALEEPKANDEQK